MSKAAIERVGFLSSFFKHSGADFEYGLKLHASGGVVLLAAGYVGRCERNEVKHIRSMSLAARYKDLLSYKNLSPGQRFKYFEKHGGRLWPILWVTPYITLPFRHYKDKLYNKFRHLFREFL